MIDSLFSVLVQQDVQQFHMIGYVLAFFGAFTETIIGLSFLVPGSFILLALSALAQQGYISFAGVLIVAIIGAIIGDNIAYFLGRRYGSAWLYTKKNHFIARQYVQRAEKLFARYGAWGVFFGRFFIGLKETIPLIAGSVGMRRRTFFLYNVLGSIGWGILWGGVGYIFAHSLEQAHLWITRAGFIVLFLVILFIVSYGVRTVFIVYGRRIVNFTLSLSHSIVRAIVTNRDVRHFVQSHKRGIEWIHRRWDRTHFFGRPLTLLTIVGLYIVSLIAGIVEDVVRSGVMTYVDVRVSDLMTIFYHDELFSFFYAITTFGRAGFAGAAIVCTGIILWIYRRNALLIGLFVSTIGAATTTKVAKIFFARMRPEAALITEHSYSFPSGHATIAVAFYGFLTYIAIRFLRTWRWRINLLFIGTVLIGLIGFSRIYLNVHYVSDVLAGFLVGALWLTIGISIVEWAQYNRIHFLRRTHLLRMRRGVVLVCGTVLIGMYGFFILHAPAYHVVRVQRAVHDIANIQEMLIRFKRDDIAYTETLARTRQEPLSIIILAANDRQLIETFKAARWLLADDITPRSLLQWARAATVQGAYPTAPMTPSFWSGRVHDFGFQKAFEGGDTARKRHHARFWRTDFRIDGLRVYVGTASFDKGVKWGITHIIDPAIDVERTLIKHDLMATGSVIMESQVPFVDPVLGKNFVGDPFFTDGNIIVLKIRQKE